MVTTCGASPSSSMVARCAASSVRIASTGYGRRTRASTVRSTSRMKQRRSKVCKARTAACSSAAVNRAVARARMIARPASAKVSADVTRSVPGDNGFMAVVSRSSRAATSARDSMYRIVAAGALGRRARVAAFGPGPRREALRVATIAVNQFSGGARWQPDVGPVLERITSFNGRMEEAGRHQFVPPGFARGPATVSRASAKQ